VASETQFHVPLEVSSWLITSRTGEGGGGGIFMESSLENTCCQMAEVLMDDYSPRLQCFGGLLIALLHTGHRHSITRSSGTPKETVALLPGAAPHHSPAEGVVGA